MAKIVGAVRRKSGELLYFIYNTCGDVAQPRLFNHPEDAENVAYVHQGSAWKLAYKPGGEAVEAMPYYTRGKEQVMFNTRIDPVQGVIVGPLSAESAQEEGLPNDLGL